MSRAFRREVQYAAEVDAIWRMLCDRAAWEAKYAAVGASDVRWLTFEVTAEAATITSERTVPADIPAAARSVVGDSARVTQTEQWRRTADGLQAELDVSTRGAPGGTTGTMRVTPDPDVPGYSRWAVNLTIAVPVPLLGGKLERVMEAELDRNFRAEEPVIGRWLADLDGT